MVVIYNSESRKKEEFKPLKEGEVGMYVCGPTVYDVAHLGHGRSAVAFDIIRRYFEYKEYKVKFVSNYTDIDDKMINRAHEEGISVKELSERIIPEYQKDYGDLEVKVPDVQPRATDAKYIKEMIALIYKLENGGYTYVIEDDGVYFDVSKFSDYGKFSGQNLEDLKAGARIEVDERKQNPCDFALWKLKKDKDEPFWESPWGKGRPGWHIECSAMSKVELGESFDIHGGGLDLKFPHHECEVAQSKCAYGAGSFAKYWLHNGFIQIDNEKMSKSLGNFFTLKNIFVKYRPQVVRFMFLQTHYRNPINFSDKLLEQAGSGLRRIHDFVFFLKRGIENSVIGDGLERVELWISEARKRFEAAMNDDFDTSGALGAVFELIKAVNTSSSGLSGDDFKAVLRFFEEIDAVLGVLLFETVDIDVEIEDLIEKRNLARIEKDFERADEIRDLLFKKGIILEDTPERTIWKRK